MHIKNVIFVERACAFCNTNRIPWFEVLIQRTIPKWNWTESAHLLQKKNIVCVLIWIGNVFFLFIVIVVVLGYQPWFRHSMKHLENSRISCTCDSQVVNLNVVLNGIYLLLNIVNWARPEIKSVFECVLSNQSWENLVFEQNLHNFILFKVICWSESGKRNNRNNNKKNFSLVSNCMTKVNSGTTKKRDTSILIWTWFNLVNKNGAK